MTIRTRHLTRAETDALPVDFTRAFRISDVELIDREHNAFAKNKIVCRGPRLFWQDYPTDFTRMPLLIQSLLVHELCHVWQYETGRLTAFRYLINPRNWIYAYDVRENADFDDYPTEKQADLLQDWFLVNSGSPPLRFAAHKGTAPEKDWLNRIVPFDWTP